MRVDQMKWFSAFDVEYIGMMSPFPEDEDDVLVEETRQEMKATRMKPVKRKHSRFLL